MKITIISVGKFKNNNPHKAVFELYEKRIKWQINLKEIEAKNFTNHSPNEIKEGEGKLILNFINSLKSKPTLIALERDGKQLSSNEFAKLLAKISSEKGNEIALIIGGAEGLSSEVMEKCSVKISLGNMIFPHLMVRSILAEQIYRAQTIINNHPYHRED